MKITKNKTSFTLINASKKWLPHPKKAKRKRNTSSTSPNTTLIIKPNLLVTLQVCSKTSITQLLPIFLIRFGYTDVSLKLFYDTELSVREFFGSTLDSKEIPFKLSWHLVWAIENIEIIIHSTVLNCISSTFRWHLVLPGIIACQNRVEKSRRKMEISEFLFSRDQSSLKSVRHS